MEGLKAPLLKEDYLMAVIKEKEAMSQQQT